MKFLRNSAAAVTLLASSPLAAAGGYTVIAAPTEVEIVRSDGFMILGPYGNEGPTPCEAPNRIWVASTHPQYKELLSISLTALSSGMKLQGYAHVCTHTGWFGPSVNEVAAGGSLKFIK